MNENPVTKKNWIPLAACLAIILVSAFFGFTVGKFSNHQEAFLTETRLSDSHYRFTNPLLDYQPAPPALITRNIRELEDNLNEFIESEIEQSHIINASVYYRDLENGPWISVNGDNEYTPASLLKVPLLIAYYKQAEKDPSILTRSITYKDEFSSIPSHNLEHTPSTINLGDTYTVSELLEMMIKQSDNIATLLLEANIESEQADGKRDEKPTWRRELLRQVHERLGKVTLERALQGSCIHRRRPLRVAETLEAPYHCWFPLPSAFQTFALW